MGPTDLVAATSVTCEVLLPLESPLNFASTLQKLFCTTQGTSVADMHYFPRVCAVPCPLVVREESQHVLQKPR